ncbi:hypothetical protein [Streptomyces sp. NPDC050759]|uniref:hypothetical protein n=1 Tax=Streptomyces sp. NPDC050759 TaxID=3365635 RepID=UPI003797C7D8
MSALAPRSTRARVPARPPEPAGSFLELPVRAREASSDVAFEEPEPCEPLGVRPPGYTCDGTDFRTSSEVVRTDGGEAALHRTGEQRIPRTAG